MENKFLQLIKKPNKTFLAIVIGVLVCGVLLFSAYSLFIANDTKTITMGVNESYTIATSQSDYKIDVKSTDIVECKSDSTITAKAVGKAEVVVKYGLFSKETYVFNIVAAPKKVTLSDSKLSLGVNESYTISASCHTGSHSFGVTFNSSNKAVASVDKFGFVQAKGVGECIVTVSAYNGTKSECKVTVFSEPTLLTLSHSELTLGVGESEKLTAYYNENEFSNSVSYLSSNEKVATVSNNTVTALSVGECTITASTYNGKEQTCFVTVKAMPQTLNLIALDKYSLGSSFSLITDTAKNTAFNDFTISVSDEAVLEQDSEEPLVFHCKKQGTATITLTLSNGVSATKTVTVGDYWGNTIDNFNILNQYPTLPTGCEVVSLTSVLNHYGFDVSMTTMADDYMPKTSDPYFYVNPHEYFMGSPYDKDGFGCFSGCIVKTAESFFADIKNDEYIAVDISGCTAEDVFNYLENDIPVITWVTSSFLPVSIDGSWTVDGQTYTWYQYEHCLVTTGYDKSVGTVIVADDCGGYTYAVSMDTYRSVFEGTGAMAVVILKK